MVVGFGVVFVVDGSEVSSVVCDDVVVWRRVVVVVSVSVVVGATDVPIVVVDDGADGVELD